MIIQTTRLQLQSLDASHYEDFLTFITDEQAIKYMALELSETSPKEMFTSLLTQNDHLKQTYALIHKTQHTYIGYVGYEYMQDEQAYHVHWAINPMYWKQGYAKEAMQELLKHINGTVYAYIHPQNDASNRLADSLNMKFMNTIEIIPGLYHLNQFKLELFDDFQNGCEKLV